MYLLDFRPASAREKISHSYPGIIILTELLSGVKITMYNIK